MSSYIEFFMAVIIELIIYVGQEVMGEAKRRKKLDPNYGKPVVIGGKTDLEWKKEWCFTDREWQNIKPYFRVVDTVDDVDKMVDGVWIFYFQGKERIGFTGKFANDFGGEENVVESDLIVVDSRDDVDDRIDAVWKYKDDKGTCRFSYTGTFANEVARNIAGL